MEEDPLTCVDVTDLSRTLDIDGFVTLLRERFEHTPYLMCARACVSVNPFAWRNIYGPREHTQYLHAPDGALLPAHLYHVVERARRGLGVGSQTLVVTGESGAGKTEVARLSLQYLSYACDASSHASVLLEDVLRANHLLEFIGNAETQHNGNSSRFGKLLSVRYARDGAPLGACVTTHLLERCRVVAPEAPDGAFRIFYAILDDAQSNDEFALHAIPRALLGRADAAVPSSWSTFGALCDALHLDPSAARMVQHTVAGILSLNLRDFAHVASILDTERNVASTIVNRRMIVGNEVIWTACDLDEIKARCRALAMHLYQRMFDAVVAALNARLAVAVAEEEAARFNVLDMFGFECMTETANGIDQLCINYANERLHRLFLDVAVVAQEHLYRAEGLPWEAPSVGDVHRRGLDACEQHIFRLMDEAERTKGDAFALVDAILAACPAAATAPKVRSNEAIFVLHHYARPVRYAAADFVARNVDALRAELTELIASTRSPCLVPMCAVGDEPGSPAVGRRFATSVVASFRKQMDGVMRTVAAGGVHFVRCLRPNDQSAANTFDAELVRAQIASSGLVEACQVARLGHEHQLEHHDLRRRFARVHAIERVVTDLGGAWGHTRAFLSDEAHTRLVQLESVLVLQAAARKVAARRRNARCRAALRLQSASRRRLARVRFGRRRDAALMLWRNVRRWHEARRLQTCAQLRAEVERLGREVRRRDAWIFRARGLLAIRSDERARRFATSALM